MSVRIHLLRAVNVGGATLPMAELRQIATDLGARDVSTYIASGNLLCEPSTKDFDLRLEQAIEERFGFFREVISRSVEELVAALAAHPFDVLEPKRSYISFLLERPSPGAISKARTFETGDDRWDAVGRDWHVRYADGAGRPQMKDSSILRALGVPGTARNLNTVRRLIDLAS